jgi:IS5 family transposase
MPRAHFRQQWFNLSNLVMDDAFFDAPLFPEFVGLPDNFRLPGESTTPWFRHQLENHGLAVKILAEVNAILGEPEAQRK